RRRGGGFDGQPEENRTVQERGDQRDFAGCRSQGSAGVQVRVDLRNRFLEQGTKTTVVTVICQGRIVYGEIQRNVGRYAVADHGLCCGPGWGGLLLRLSQQPDSGEPGTQQEDCR